MQEVPELHTLQLQNPDIKRLKVKMTCYQKYALTNSHIFKKNAFHTFFNFKDRFFLRKSHVCVQYWIVKRIQIVTSLIAIIPFIVDIIIVVYQLFAISVDVMLNDIVFIDFTFCVNSKNIVMISLEPYGNQFVKCGQIKWKMNVKKDCGPSFPFIIFQRNPWLFRKRFPDKESCNYISLPTMFYKIKTIQLLYYFSRVCQKMSKFINKII